MNRLIFVYNADGGMANALLDTGNRLFKPADYPCPLCKVTYGPFGMKRDWKKFVLELAYPVEFLHKDELRKSLRGVIKDFPSIALQENGHTRILISSEEFGYIKDLDTLKQKVTKALDEHCSSRS